MFRALRTLAAAVSLALKALMNLLYSCGLGVALASTPRRGSIARSNAPVSKTGTVNSRREFESRPLRQPHPCRSGRGVFSGRHSDISLLEAEQPRSDPAKHQRPLFGGLVAHERARLSQRSPIPFAVANWWVVAPPHHAIGSKLLVAALHEWWDRLGKRVAISA